MLPTVSCQQRRGFAAEKMEFKAETKKLLDIMAKSLYTDKEVFIRELISNASDACEKLRFLQSTNAAPMDETKIEIRVTVDEENRRFIIQDTGVGMTKDELISNIGTIARSGSLEFVNDPDINAADKANAIIGQFGVGFYSSFVVADRVEVFTRSGKEANAPGYRWESDGEGSFTIEECADLERGTKIVIYLREDAAEFAKPHVIRKAATKFSSFVNFPIALSEDDGKEAKEMNKQEALWMKSNPSEDDHVNFYRFLNNTSYGEPFYTMNFSTDAPLTIKSIFYVPEDAPSRLYSEEPQVGISLYSRRVMVQKHADGIIPKWLHWVKGVVDCEDMPMHISRESMQDTRLQRKLGNAVVKRFLKFLDQQSKLDAEKFGKFYENYSHFLKIGLIHDREPGENNGKFKDDLLRLLRFECTNKESKEMITLQGYVDSAKEGQKNIYYFCAPDRKTALASPYMEQFAERNRNVLIMYDDIDEFLVTSALDGFKDMKLVPIDAQDKDFELDLDAPEEKRKEEIKLSDVDQTEIVSFMKDVLGNKVMDIKFTDRLVNSPAVVTSLLTPHMRKMMKNMMAGQGKSDSAPESVPVTLELSARHHLIATLWHIHKTNPDVAKAATDAIFDNAMISANLLDEPRQVLKRMDKLIEMFVYQGAGYDYKEKKYAHEIDASASASAPDASATPTSTTVEAEVTGEQKEQTKAEEPAPEMKTMKM